ncbi:hypothetical protein Purlil1_11049 [Purpureocillium lilacinum]|uniref:C3H1-type domain-containing protein n=1 Tax=Purpureocillium lilacinum TaxID=33203 RepID=A0ABR0BKL3_PURLI|nr:hypothetical protein Purlil1_11049 [Purpureocillium lilacinum]
MHRFDKRHPSPPPNHGPWSAEGSTVRGCFVSSSTSHQGLASYPTTHRLGVQHQQRDRRWSGHIASSSSSSGSGSAMSVSLRYDTNNGTVGGLAPSSGQQLSDRTMPTVTVLDGIEGSGYYLDRGNGQVTRLIPADVLPQLGDLPAREMYHPSMVVLGTPIGDRPNMLAGVNGAVTIKKSPDRHPGGPITTSGSNSSKTSRRHKVYCDKWIHEGVCAFTQQGCKFKHEMPFDEETQRSLGLFQGLPGWYLKSQDETRSSIPLSGEQVGRVTDHTRAGERRDVVASHPLSGFDKMHRAQDGGRPLVPYNWGPVGTPARKRPAGSGVCIDGQKGHRAHYRAGPTQSVAEFAGTGLTSEGRIGFGVELRTS